MEALHSYRHAVAGAGGGLITVALLHPLDTLRTRMQVSDYLRHVPGGKLHRLLGPTVRTVQGAVRDGGALALYKGVVPAMFGATVSWGFYFQCFNFVRDQIAATGSERRVLVHLFAGTTAGVITCVVTNPIWVVKTRLQLQNNLRSGSGSAQRPYRNFFAGFAQVLREEGVRGLYKGLGPALWLVSQGAIQFALYEELKEVSFLGFEDGGHATTVSQSLFASTVSKVAASVITYPLQVVRTTMQQRNADQKRYGSLGRAGRTVVQQEGWRGLYKGMIANVLRVTPSAAITFVTYERIMQLLSHAQA